MAVDAITTLVASTAPGKSNHDPGRFGTPFASLLQSAAATEGDSPHAAPTRPAAEVGPHHAADEGFAVAGSAVHPGATQHAISDSRQATASSPFPRVTDPSARTLHRDSSTRTAQQAGRSAPGTATETRKPDASKAPADAELLPAAAATPPLSPSATVPDASPANLAAAAAALLVSGAPATPAPSDTASPPAADPAAQAAAPAPDGTAAGSVAANQAIASPPILAGAAADRPLPPPGPAAAAPATPTPQAAAQAASLAQGAGAGAVTVSVGSSTGSGLAAASVAPQTAVQAQADAAPNPGTGNPGDPHNQSSGQTGGAQAAPGATSQQQPDATDASPTDSTMGPVAASTMGPVAPPQRAGQAEAAQAGRLAAGEETTAVKPLEAQRNGSAGEPSAPLPTAALQNTPREEVAAEGSAEVQAPRPPVLPSPAEQIRLQVGKNLKDGNDTISLELHPADLGRVDVKLEMRDGQVKATITADRPETLILLKNDAASLQQSLQDVGLRADGDALSFQLRGEQQQRQPSGEGYAPGERRGSPLRASEAEPIAAPVPPSPALGSVTSGVDLSV